VRANSCHHTGYTLLIIESKILGVDQWKAFGWWRLIARFPLVDYTVFSRLEILAFDSSVLCERKSWNSLSFSFPSLQSRKHNKQVSKLVLAKMENTKRSCPENVKNEDQDARVECPEKKVKADCTSKTVAYEVNDGSISFKLYGRACVAEDKNYPSKLLEVSQPMWNELRTAGLKGTNVWAYYKDDNLFTGVQLAEAPPDSMGLEERNIQLARFAYYKHVGPYEQIHSVCESVNDSLRASGFKAHCDGADQVTPFIVEVYGDWCENSSKLETEIYFALKTDSEATSENVLYDVKDEGISFHLYGKTCTAPGYDCYTKKLLEVSQPMWAEMKSAGICVTNVWAYYKGDNLFSGFLLPTAPPESMGLQGRTIQLTRYAYHKHIGPYEKLHSICASVISHLKSQGFKNGNDAEIPFLVEVYSHWSEDTSKLVTELYFASN
jgi:predicted transcriptional regulator YdeE